MTCSDYCHRGWDLIRKKDYDGAIGMFNMALAENPDSYSALDARAGAYVAKGEYEKALADFNRMIALKPQDPDGWNGRGNMYHDRGEYDKAIADFTQCIPLSWPHYGTYWSNRGISHYKKGELDAALADLNTSIECWEYPESTGWALLHRGLVWLKMGDIEKALADFTLSAARNPDTGNAFSQVGAIWFKRGDYEKAIEWFSKAIEAKDDVAEYWLSRGACYWNQCLKNKIGFWGEGSEAMDLAEDDFTRAVECAPDMAGARFSRGMLHCSRARESHRLMKAILSEKAADEATRALLMAQLGHIGGKDLIPQFDAILRGLRSDRDKADEIVAKSLVLFVDYDAHEALDDLSRAVELDPNNAAAWYERGLAWTLLGEKDKAIQDLEQTCALDPDHRKAAEKLEELLEGGE